MNIVFFGSSDFAEPSLRALARAAHKISCVVTQPDRKSGRGLHLAPTAIKTAAQKFGFKVYQPERINSPEGIEFLKSVNADLFVVIAYGQILSGGVLGIPKIFSINTHASLLPKYRGAAPINWAIINGDEATGITVIKLDAKMDAGPILLQESIPIAGEDTFATLEDKLSRETPRLLLESIKQIEDGKYKLIPQGEDKATLAPKLKKSDGLIAWDRSAEDICNLVRGCLGWPNAFTYYNGKLLKIFKSKSCSAAVSAIPGVVANISSEGIVVNAGKGNLVIEELQIEGKRAMTASEFVGGHRIAVGDRFGNPP